jgi:hypothetical protein
VGKLSVAVDDQVVGFDQAEDIRGIHPQRVLNDAAVWIESRQFRAAETAFEIPMSGCGM